MKTILKRFVRDEDGAAAIEYGLIAALVSVVLITGATLLGTNLSDMFSGIAGLLTGP